MHFRALLAPFLLSGSALASDLCIQGCCGLSAKLPSSSLSLEPVSGTKGAQAVQLPLENSELPCCPCEETTEQETRVGGASVRFYSCAEGDCEPFCTCDSHVRPRPGEDAKPQLRRLCPQGTCNPEQCMCYEELQQGVHDAFFHDLRLVKKNQTSGDKPQNVAPAGEPSSEYCCAEGDCEAVCDCQCNSRKDGTPKPRLRRLCPKDVCHPAECMCYAELLQGIHDYFFHDYTLVAKGHAEAAIGAERLAGLFGQQNILGDKSEL